MYFLKKGIVDYILAVGNSKDEIYLSRISKYTKTTFAYTFKITKYLNSQGIIKVEKIGRIRKVELTEKGTKIYNLLSEIEKILDF